MARPITSDIIIFLEKTDAEWRIRVEAARSSKAKESRLTREKIQSLEKGKDYRTPAQKEMDRREAFELKKILERDEDAKIFMKEAVERITATLRGNEAAEIMKTGEIISRTSKEHTDSQKCYGPLIECLYERVVCGENGQILLVVFRSPRETRNTFGKPEFVFMTDSMSQMTDDELKAIVAWENSRA
ncbi:hypothetical protein L0Y46_04460 [bacterium]|nr:hypothetical protein [bacterium]